MSSVVEHPTFSIFSVQEARRGRKVCFKPNEKYANGQSCAETHDRVMATNSGDQHPMHLLLVCKPGVTPPHVARKKRRA
ncbi:hypothetical protein PUN28_009629 [Cardiocondyla obscurior]|uniref:Uncharacterized protein n=1 Tax=Cardiocondyla obscurior TaxID=286306 RepID=A0AAW2FYA8_9HYME